MFAFVSIRLHVANKIFYENSYCYNSLVQQILRKMLVSRIKLRNWKYVDEII